eukprot:TRINITY_DN1102_c0_g3_i4.p1 TRINITY_DN1102_c0_g3~~TRINITY_DN1102_c0_g3_i4.p1  ORF type:complete len:397 (-),score=114.45 TRINITY_DN1102_c0_g3_i4:288-1478(-)
MDAGSGDVGDLSVADLRALNEELDAKLAKGRMDLSDLQKAFSRQAMEKENLEGMLSGKSNWGASTGEVTEKMKQFLVQCQKQVRNSVTSPGNDDWAIWKGYGCEASGEEIARYMNYPLRGLCPDDWFFVQHLVFVKNCFALPKRRCLNRTPQASIEPLPKFEALFDQRALIDEDIRWELHGCKSIACLNARKTGDCRNCFNMTLEGMRWKTQYRGSLTIRDLFRLKPAGIRLGLDVGRGSGSFAAHMSVHNVTVMTMGMNIETRQGVRIGLPYMETIALRGLVPIHVPHRARLPYFDGVLDLIHTQNSVKYLPLAEFEELLYEWDRVLRAGGVIWFELFYAPNEEMDVYQKVIDLLGYKRLYWNLTLKPLAETKGVPHTYLNCLLEKPSRADTRKK